MQYALIKNTIVQNIIEADQGFADSIATEWDAVVSIEGVTPAPGIGWSYEAGVFTAPVAPPAPEPIPEPRHITVGAFFDRFGNQKWPILSSPDLGVQGLIKDASVRRWIDLDDEQLPAGLDMLIAAGFPIDKEAVINAPIQPKERP
jgi:hypothetical protein